jgi:ornithine cyclodeaminase/alanine dehydrogenase
MAPVIGAPIVPVSDLPHALAHSDIVVTCTTSRRPLVRPSDVRPGTFIAAVGADNPEKHEIDPELMAASKVVTDVTAQSATIGDLRHAIATGLMQAGEVYAELGEIVTGRKAGRTSDDEVFVFDSTGMALQDVAAAVLVYQHALTRRTGREVAINSPTAGGSRSRFINVLARARHRI